MHTSAGTIKILKHHEIDFVAWDSCIAQSPQCIVYGTSWFLNIVSPKWSALVLEKKGIYVAVIPLSIKSKWGLKYLAQPFATQQLGFFYNGNADAFVQFVLKYLLRKFWIVDYNLNYGNAGISMLPPFKIIDRLTYCLRLDATYEAISQHFSENHKRNIKKGKKLGLTVKANEDFAILVNLFRSTKGREMPEVTGEHYDLLLNIFNAAKNAGSYCSLIASDATGNVYAGAFFILYQKRLIYLMGATSEEGRKNGAMHLLFDDLIQQYVEHSFVLDFEGGEMEGIGRFYQGFGAVPEYYRKLKYSKFPFFKK